MDPRRKRYREAAIVYFFGALATILLTLLGGIEGEVGLPSRERLLTLPIGIAFLGIFAILIWKTLPWLSRGLAFLFSCPAAIRLVQFGINASGRRFDITYWPPSVSVHELAGEGQLLYVMNALITVIIIGMLLRAALYRSS
jgi:hypothetical protein